MIDIKDKETGNIKTFNTIGDFVDFINPIAERQGLEITVDNQEERENNKKNRYIESLVEDKILEVANLGVEKK